MYEKENAKNELSEIVREWYLTNCFVKGVEDDIALEIVCPDIRLSDGLIQKLVKQLDWEDISLCYKFSEDFMSEYKEYLDWNYVSCFQKLSENSMRNHKDYIVMLQSELDIS